MRYGYMTEEFARQQTRKFNVYINDKEEADKQERARQLEEHKIRVANAKKKSKKGV